MTWRVTSRICSINSWRDVQLVQVGHVDHGRDDSEVLALPFRAEPSRIARIG